MFFLWEVFTHNKYPVKMSDEAENVSYEVADVLNGTAHWEDYLTPAPMCIAFLGE